MKLKARILTKVLKNDQVQQAIAFNEQSLHLCIRYKSDLVCV